jgi:hypothetical protein
MARIESGSGPHPDHHRSSVHATSCAHVGVMFSLDQYSWSVAVRWRFSFEGHSHAFSCPCLRCVPAPTPESAQFETQDLEVTPHNVTSVRDLFVAIRPLLRVIDVLPLAAPAAQTGQDR